MTTRCCTRTVRLTPLVTLKDRYGPKANARILVAFWHRGGRFRPGADTQRLNNADLTARAGKFGLN